MNEVSKERCEKCKYWQRIKCGPRKNLQMRSGFCRRYPPSYTLGQAYAKTREEIDDFNLWQMGMFPKTSPFDWCGEYQQLTVKKRSS